MNHLIIGYGEIGKAIRQLIYWYSSDHIYVSDPVLEDKIDESEIWVDNNIDIMHVCFPCSDQSHFIEECKSYEHEVKPKLSIIHSTVPMGTTDLCGSKFVHSPVRGVHPHLLEGLETFVKYFGGHKSDDAAKIFDKLGVSTKAYKDARVTEALKMWSTTQYGVSIALEKIIHKWCEDNGLPFEEIYTEANMSYNNGYRELGKEQFVRPILNHVAGPIGGHCVMPNLELLGQETINTFVNEAIEDESTS